MERRGIRGTESSIPPLSVLELSLCSSSSDNSVNLSFFQQLFTSLSIFNWISFAWHLQNPEKESRRRLEERGENKQKNPKSNQKKLHSKGGTKTIFRYNVAVKMFLVSTHIQQQNSKPKPNKTLFVPEINYFIGQPLQLDWNGKSKYMLCPEALSKLCEQNTCNLSQ